VVTKGKKTPAEKEAAVRRIKGTTAYEALKPADVIIEAATEAPPGALGLSRTFPCRLYAVPRNAAA
jgi:hypothetical protein